MICNRLFHCWYQTFFHVMQSLIFFWWQKRQFFQYSSTHLKIHSIKRRYCIIVFVGQFWTYNFGPICFWSLIYTLESLLFMSISFSHLPRYIVSVIIGLLKKGQLLFSDISRILDNIDGCYEQYRCDTALYLLSILAHTYNIIIDRSTW